MIALQRPKERVHGVGHWEDSGLVPLPRDGNCPAVDVDARTHQIDDFHTSTPREQCKANSRLVVTSHCIEQTSLLFVAGFVFVFFWLPEHIPAPVDITDGF